MQRSQIGVNQQQRRKYSSEDARVFKQIEFDDVGLPTPPSPFTTNLYYL